MTDLVRRLKETAHAIGFDRIGITHAGRPETFDRYRTWVEKGYAAGMWYLTEAARMEKRGDLQKILPGARSVISGAISYAPRTPPPASGAKFARYAWGADYHDVVREKMEELARWLSENSAEPFRYLTYVDTGPLLERNLAERAGVGWIGKNTCVMHETTGSYLYLGEILTTLELPADVPATNRCGTCTRCLDACPTGALEKPYQLNAAKCISYQTIENRSDEIPAEIAKNLNGWVAGCDICQEVCPWNNEPLETRLDALSPLPHASLTLEEAAALDEKTYRSLFKGTSLRRISFRNFIRNVKAAMHHSSG